MAQPSNCRRTKRNEGGARTETAQGTTAAFCFIYRALVGFFSSVPSHVDHQHVLGLKGLLLSGTLLPSAHKLLLFSVDVVVVDVLERQKSHSVINMSTEEYRKWFLLRNIQFPLFPSWVKSSALLHKQEGKKKNQSSSVQAEQDFQMKPCHFTSHRCLAPP